MRPVGRDISSGHRRYSDADIAMVETLANLRAVVLRVQDMRAYLASARRGDALELRRRYLDLKVQYWSARDVGDRDKSATVADEVAQIINRIRPKDPA